MKLRLLAFGIAKDIVGGSNLEFHLKQGNDISALRQALIERYPQFGALRSLAFAVEDEYRPEDFPLSENIEVVLLPPVSGG